MEYGVWELHSPWPRLLVTLNYENSTRGPTEASLILPGQEEQRKQV